MTVSELASSVWPNIYLSCQNQVFAVVVLNLIHFLKCFNEVCLPGKLRDLIFLDFVFFIKPVRK